MADSTQSGGASASPPAQKGFLRRHWGKMSLLTLLSIVVVVGSVWMAVTLFYPYSQGDRTGYLQKLSRKGWICKTWEGEVAMSNVPGQMPEKFYFTIHGDSLAKAFQIVEGKRVTISYSQHVLIPTSCFGDTPYWASGVKLAE